MCGRTWGILIDHPRPDDSEVQVLTEEEIWYLAGMVRVYSPLRCFSDICQTMKKSVVARGLMYISVTKWGRSGFLDFTMLVFILSSFMWPFIKWEVLRTFLHNIEPAKSLQYVFEDKQPKKDRPETILAAQEASVHPGHNCLFAICRMNERCSNRRSRQLMLLINV